MAKTHKKVLSLWDFLSHVVLLKAILGSYPTLCRIKYRTKEKEWSNTIPNAMYEHPSCGMTSLTASIEINWKKWQERIMTNESVEKIHNDKKAQQEKCSQFFNINS